MLHIYYLVKRLLVMAFTGGLCVCAKAIQNLYFCVETFPA